MSDQEVLVGKRKINRLNLDSDEQARQEAQERERQQQIRQKKEEKRRRREEEARRIEEEQKKLKELQLHYEPDSDSDDAFERVEKKIKKTFPNFKHQNHHKHRHVSESQQSEESDSEDEESSSSEEESSEVPRRKKDKQVAKKERRQRRREESEELRASRHKAEKVKVEQKDPKELLVGEVAVRWWYCLPEWPPADFDYQAQLKKQGYRLVDNSRFRMQENLVHGLYKATPIEGYVGVFKSKLKIIDVRPKESCPSLQLLRSKTMEELTGLLKTALKEQINSLNSQKYQGGEDLDLITKLTRRLNQISV